MAKKIEITIEEKLRALFDLQLIDSRIDEIRNIRGELPLEVEDLENEIEGSNVKVEKITSEISDFEKLSVNQFKIKIGSMPKISLELVENRPSSSVKLLSNNSNLNFKICITIDSIDNNSSVVYVKFEGKFSTMIEMMIKNPLEKFINSLKNKVEELDF